MDKAGTIVARHSREIEDAGSEGGVQAGGREGTVTSVAIVEDFCEDQQGWQW